MLLQEHIVQFTNQKKHTQTGHKGAYERPTRLHADHGLQRFCQSVIAGDWLHQFEALGMQRIPLVCMMATPEM